MKITRRTSNMFIFFCLLIMVVLIILFAYYLTTVFVVVVILLFIASTWDLAKSITKTLFNGDDRKSDKDIIEHIKNICDKTFNNKRDK